MPTTYKQKNRRQSNIISTVITAILIFTVFLSVISYFYKNAEEEANEMLHLQTKQIKDDLTLQLKSDRENLVTMANFAAKLYADGESYDIMFESFEPIGLFSNIGVLNPDNTFVTKMGSIDLDGKISFEEEVAKGEYVSGRVEDLTREGKEIIRSSVPIVSDGKTVGVLYGVILLENIGNKYNNMAKELDAQLFVYDKETGKFVIDTINKNPGELSQLKTRKYNEGYSYEDIANSDKGYSSFRSIYRDEDLYVHFSTLEEFDWGIMLARYETQVFAKTHKITNFLTLTFLVIVLIIVIYFLIIIKNEKLLALITKKASDIRKQLLEINEKPENIKNSLKKVMDVSSACSAMFFDTEGEDHHYTSPKNEKYILSEEDRKYFKSEIFRYAIQLKTTAMTEMSVANIRPDEHLRKINPEFYDFLNKHGIKSVIFSAISQTNNDNVSVLGLINPKNIICAKGIVEKIAVCFSIAIHNKNHLNKTYTAATTDSLTGALNRVAYKKDLLLYDEEKSPLFTCIYIDVNELHIRNNRYGHAAGDEMLIYIANALKNLFFDQKVYRMGGDEFLVFVSNTEQATVKHCLELFTEQLTLKNYHVAIGVSHRTQNTNTEELVREAEIRMYDAKASYYQNKEKASITSDNEKNYIMSKTGIREIDTLLSVLKEHYNGIYRVNLETDKAHRILMPSYLGYNEDENDFSMLFTKYVDDSVDPDYHRAVISFLNYDTIKRQISEDIVPKVTYKKANGENVVLSVYNLGSDKDSAKETLWVFSKNL